MRGDAKTLNTIEEKKFVISNVLPANLKVWIGLHYDDPGSSGTGRGDGLMVMFLRTKDEDQSNPV